MYIKFNINGIQEEIVNQLDEVTDGWYEISEDINGKIFKLVKNKVVAMSEEEKKLYMDSLMYSSTLFFLKDSRNRLLASSDWTQLPGSSLSDEKKVEWESYRQALRDLPETLTEDLTYSLPEAPQ